MLAKFLATGSTAKLVEKSTQGPPLLTLLVKTPAGFTIAFCAVGAQQIGHLWFQAQSILHGTPNLLQHSPMPCCDGSTTGILNGTKEETRMQNEATCAPQGERINSPRREENSVDKAAAIIAADREHRSLAADQVLMLRMVIPSYQAQTKQLQEGLFRWFQHQGFWKDDESDSLRQFREYVDNPFGGSMADFGNDRHYSKGVSAYYIRLKMAEKIALLHSEATEMLEASRKDDFGNLGEEAADLLIRLLDFCAGFGIDLGHAFEQKMIANYHRPFKHGKEF